MGSCTFCERAAMREVRVHIHPDVELRLPACFDCEPAAQAYGDRMGRVIAGDVYFKRAARRNRLLDRERRRRRLPLYSRSDES